MLYGPSESLGLLGITGWCSSIFPYVSYIRYESFFSILQSLTPKPSNMGTLLFGKNGHSVGQNQCLGLPVHELFWLVPQTSH